MSYPAGFPNAPGTPPPGYGFPPPKKSNATLRAIAAVIGLAVIVLAGIGVKTTFFDKKSDDTPSRGAPTSSSIAAPTATRLPPLSTAPSAPNTHVIEGGEGWEAEAGCLAAGKPPEVCKQMRDDKYPGGSAPATTGASAPAPAPTSAAGGYVPATPTSTAVEKYLHSVRLDSAFASVPDQDLVDTGLKGCVYLSTATGATPLSIGQGFAAQIDVPRTQAMEILGAATGAFCREFIDKMTR